LQISFEISVQRYRAQRNIRMRFVVHDSKRTHSPSNGVRKIRTMTN
jgi:hypothetical protein